MLDSERLGDGAVYSESIFLATGQRGSLLALVTRSLLGR